MKINVDFDKCVSNAVCMSMEPEIFEVKDDGYLYVLNENPDESLRERLNAVVAGCPTQAISLENE